MKDWSGQLFVPSCTSHPSILYKWKHNLTLKGCRPITRGILSRVGRIRAPFCTDEHVAMTIYFYKVSDLYGCFSNFSLHPIEIEGIPWQTVEHYYQAQKFVNSENEGLIQVIRNVNTPMEAAQIGRDRTLILRSDWEDVKQQVMWQGVLTKFMTHTDIQSILLDTGEEVIVEDSPTDYYWGCGQDKTGQNQLGKILMNVRQEIRWRRLSK